MTRTLCPDCEGEAGEDVCELCEGEGTIDPPICTACDGSGEGHFDGSTCQTCRGSGVIKPVEEDPRW